MKASDITVGEAYGWTSYEGGRQERAVVLEKSVQGQDWAKRPFTGHKVRFDDGKVVVVPGRELRNTWAQEVQRREEARKRRIEQRERSTEGRARRSYDALRANDLLLALGAEEREEWLTRGRFDVETPEEVGRHLADLGFHVYFEGDGATQVKVLAAPSVVGYVTRAQSLEITPNLVPALLDVTERGQA